jgi:hypothetical protein
MRGEKMDLIERLEAATGPDRELDIEIAKAAGWVYESENRSWYRWRSPAGAIEIAPPLYTFMLDAAMTLVPEGFGHKIHGDNVEHEMQFEAQVDYGEFYPGSTAAIALCIAALKARA